ncbi:MAG: YciI family protein [Actinomycetota bacterium]|nr:YciI family protein [Actinomycetota bacterium]
MAHFLYRLIPPRPTFPADLTEAEGAIMQEHFGYWVKLAEDGRAVVYGPVMDPEGTYGIAVLEVDEVEEARQIAENDPAIGSDAGFGFEVHPMPDTIVRR